MIRKVMWSIIGRHRHLSAETLSEYLEGRIQGSSLARLERSLADCSVCREDLESLRATVALLSQLPAETPARSFVMATPPPLPAQPRPSPLARASMWAYAGAASVAAILLTVLVTADATGILAPGQPAANGEFAVAIDGRETMADDEPAEAAVLLTSAEPTPAFETDVMMDDMEPMEAGATAVATDAFAMAEPTAAAATDASAMAEPTAAAEPEAMVDDSEAMADSATAVAETGASVDGVDDVDSMDAVMADESGDLVRSQATQEPEPTLEAAPEAALEEPVPTAVSQVSPTDADATSSPDDAAGTAQLPSAAVPETPEAPTTVEQASPPPTAAPERATAQASANELAQGAEIEELPLLTEAAPDPVSEPPERGTALYWRFLEGIAGALGLAFLLALAFKWRASRARRTNLG